MITTSGRLLASAGKPVDVYSFACVVYELVAGKIPWSNAKSVAFIFQSVESGLRPALTFPSATSKEQSIDINLQQQLHDLIRLCWNQDPAERPSFTEIIKILKDANSHKKDASDFNKEKRQSFVTNDTQPSTSEGNLLTPLLLDTMERQNKE